MFLPMLVMSNHFHIALFVNKAQSARWTDAEVIAQWYKLFNGTLQSQRFVADVEQAESALELLASQVAEWRARLTDISWFMRVLNEK